MLAKKNHYSFDADDRSLKTNQVSGGDSKVSSISEPESSALTAINADNALEEFLGFRSDNAYKKMQAYRAIVNQGYISLKELEPDVSKVSDTSQTLDTYLICSGIKTTLVNNTLKTKYTIEQDLKKKL